MAIDPLLTRTTITNLLPNDQYFGFLPPHGKSIPAGGSITIEGDLRQRIQANAGAGGGSGLRAIRTLEKALSEGWLQMDSTPAAIT